MEPKNVPYEMIVKQPYVQGAIVRDDFQGFREDYLALHCLLRMYKVKSLIEIGTSTGLGTKVICKAIGVRRWALLEALRIRRDRKVYSIDVPPGTDPKLIYPEAEDGHPQRAGMYNPYPYKQLFGDSRVYDFSALYPVDAWFIDGKHRYDFVTEDSKQALRSRAQLIVWHDLQIEEVQRAITDIIERQGQNYRLCRIIGTRMGYLVREK